MSEEFQKKIDKINNTRYLKKNELEGITNGDEINNFFPDYKFIVVNMTATWCGPCQKIKPRIFEMSQNDDYSHIKFVKCDLDETDDEFSLKEETSVVPTFFLLKYNEDKDENIEIMSIFEGTYVEGLQNEIDVHMSKTDVPE